MKTNLTWEEYLETLPDNVKASDAINTIEELFKEKQTTLKAIMEEYGIEPENLFRIIRNKYCDNPLFKHFDKYDFIILMGTGDVVGVKRSECTVSGTIPLSSEDQSEIAIENVYILENDKEKQSKIFISVDKSSFSNLFSTLVDHVVDTYNSKVIYTFDTELGLEGEIILVIYAEYDYPCYRREEVVKAKITRMIGVS